MPKARRTVALILIASATLSTLRDGARAAEGATFFVAPGGDDEWSGKLAAPNARRDDGPFATITRARDAVRGLRRRQGGALERPVTVNLRGGTYRLDEPLMFTPEDSGSAEGPVTYSAYRNERPVVSGGSVVTGWRRGADGLWTAQLPDVKAGRWYFRQLFVKRPNESHFERRYRPDRGAFVVAGLTDAPHYKSRMRHRQSQDEFRFFPGDIDANWANLDDVEIVALHDWSASRLRIAHVDVRNHVVKFTGFPVYRIGHWYKKGRNPYYAENVKEALGLPGEWYLDRPTGILSYRPMPGEDVRRLTVVAPHLERLVRLAGDWKAGRFVEHIRFRGITFRHTAWIMGPKGYSSGQGMTDLPAAVEAEGARECRFELCTLAHLGAYAMRFAEGCQDNRVGGCRMFDLGGGGVLVGTKDSGAKTPKLPTGNSISNCVISDGGLVHFSAHGVWIGITEGTRLSHNVIRRFLYSNVSVGWRWDPNPSSCRDNAIENNHIHDSMMLLADGGGIYSLGFQPGTVIRGNYIHHVHRSRFAGRAPNNGIFFDQGSKGYLVEETVIHDTAGGAIRFNQCKKESLTWRDNHFDVKPTDAAFPRRIVAKAGLEPAYRDIDARPVEVPPPPILSMDLPGPPPPGPVVDDFEKTPVGRGPKFAEVSGEGGGASVRVTDETAASGKHSLKISDAPGLARPFYPYLRWGTEFSEGVATIGLAIRLERGAVVALDGRQEAHSVVGPRFSIGSDGALSAGGRKLAKVPFGEWVRLEITCPLGERSNGTYDLAVTLPGRLPSSFTKLPLADRRFRRIEYVVLTSGATKEATFYVDDVRFLPGED